MGLTTDPNDPRLTHGVDNEPVEQAEVYLVLSEEERAKGFVRPVRYTYIHVGAPGPKYPLRDLTEGEHERYDRYDYIKFEAYPEDPDSSVLGSYWTQKRLDSVGKGCGVATTMNATLAETSARDPKFYGATYCIGCLMHLQVNEFVWEDGSRVGS